MFRFPNTTLFPFRWLNLPSACYSSSGQSPLACAMLSGVMIVAIATTAGRNIKATSPLGWLSEFFYLPEVLCLVILVWLFFSGPGWLSVDHSIVSKIHLY